LKELKVRLFWLHQLNIVHLDIKPENITFSPSTGLVFIDFGLSNILEEKAGVKSSVGFSGSINFCSPEMFECYYSESQRLVDLYYNDIFCLKAAFK
jgi:serine/threonine protein kinase